MDNKAQKIESLFQELLHLIEEHPEREGVRKTPQRAAEFFIDIMNTRATNIEEVLSRSIFAEDYDEMIVLKDIEYFSLCEHHLLPFYGKAHIAYIPKGKIIGVSSLVRVVEHYAKGLQIQERLTNQIADALQKALTPLGVAVIMEGFHLCMMMRGVKKVNSYLITSAMYGCFRKETRARMEFLEFYNRLVKK